MDKPSIEQLVKRESKSRTAVIFVHGFTGDGQSTWSELGPRIMDDPLMESWDAWLITYASSFMPDLLVGLWSADADLDQIALMLCTAITKTELSQYESIVLVAHSMGGLVVQRALLNDEDIAARTHAVVLYGTPSGGLSKASRIRRFKRQLRDMVADGEFITKLRHDWNARFGEKLPFNFLAVAGESDQFVPPMSSLDPFPKENCAVVAGNHVSMIHPHEADSGASSLAVNLINNLGKSTSRFDSAQVAVERSDFKRVVSELEPRAGQLDARALVLLAIALDATGDRGKAEKYLSDREDVGSDVLGTLGGRLKRKWLLSGRNMDDAKAAQHFYSKGLKIAEENENLRQCYYLGINLAFLSLTSDSNIAKAKEYAAKVLVATAQCRKEGDVDDWLLATEAEAHLILGDLETAFAQYRDFVQAITEIWRVSSTFLNAQELAAALERKDIANSIAEIFSAK